MPSAGGADFAGDQTLSREEFNARWHPESHKHARRECPFAQGARSKSLGIQPLACNAVVVPTQNRVADQDCGDRKLSEYDAKPCGIFGTIPSPKSDVGQKSSDPEKRPLTPYAERVAEQQKVAKRERGQTRQDRKIDVTPPPSRLNRRGARSHRRPTGGTPRRGPHTREDSCSFPFSASPGDPSATRCWAQIPSRPFPRALLS